uniref:Uncharacterized protein n=1 Tax=Panagrolaimus sp. JU765 TaxID=591449 RepID=A0AC34Q712_9BILA
MPSVFSFAEEHPVVGSVGMRHLKTKNKSKAVLYDLKHLMGTNRHLNYGTWPFAICTTPEKMSFVVNSDGKFEEFTTIEIYQILLQKLKAAASAYQSDLNDKNPVNQAVITIPDFEDKLIIADVCQAAEIANIEIIDIITEIHADLLYLLSKYNVRPDEEVIIVDIGGGTGYIQKFSMIQGLKEKHVLSFLSGRRINEMLWKQLELTLLSKYQMRIDDRFILMTEMERIKETLSFDESANIQLPVIWARFKKDIEPVTKIWFEENVMARVFNDKENKKILENAMDDMNNPSKPSKVFLVGGTCWIPYIQNYFKSVFGEDKVVVPNNLQNITATGALIHGLQILNGFVEPTFVKIKI